MDVSAAKSMPAEDLLFSDGLGDRMLVRNPHGRPLQESLLLRPELTANPSFEFAVNEQLWLVERFDHPAFLTVRSIARGPGNPPAVTLVSDRAEGKRLSELLARAESARKQLTLGGAVFVIKEILDGLAELHRHNGDLSHGALAPERIVLAEGRVRIADYVLASALEQLRYSTERYWKELRVAVPSSAGGVRLDRQVDVAQVGMIAVALFASRPLRDSEHMGALGDVLATIQIPSSIRSWLTKALHMDPRTVFVGAAQAAAALADAMSEAGVEPAPADLDLEIPIVTAEPARPRLTPTVLKIAPVVTMPAPAPALAPMSASKPTVLPWRTRDVWESHDVATAPMSPGITTIRERRSPVGPNFTKFVKLALLAAALTAAFTAAQFIPAPDWLFGSTGTLVVESNPQGVTVLVNGTPQGITPLTLKVESGRHEVELRGSGKPKIFNVFVSRGDRVAQYVEFPPEPRR